MKRETQNLMLLLVGAVVLLITLDGTYLNYVKPELAPYLLISGGIIVALALTAMIRDIHGARTNSRRTGHEHPVRRTHVADHVHLDRAHGTDHVHGTNHAHGTGRAQWLLLFPVAALLFITPPALGASAADTAAPVRAAPNSPERPVMWPFPPLPDEPAPALSLSELVARATLDSQRSLDNRDVTLRGFVMRGDLARVAITCCVADARYVLVHLTGLPETFAEDTWLEIRGRVEPGSAQRDPDLTPTLTVAEYRQIDRPEHPYERVR
ncbi:TIGR03943 family putative permease subunit [Nocardia sp. NPDC127579]|uniref:TIGR03943 family putative permease subunit n=1 Tax=Nocardia sp. NPDC127579 TaxID=3345402 RepID=UPI00362E7ACE